MQTWIAAQIPFLVFTGVCVAAFGLQYVWLRKAGSARMPWLAWLFTLLLLGMGWHLTEQAGQRERDHIQSLTQDFARLYGCEMELRGHWKLPNDVAPDDPLYLSLIETEIKWEKLNPDVSDIYTLRKLPAGKNIFIVDSETDYNRNGRYDEEREQRTPVGEIYTEADAGLERAFRGEANFDFVPITDRWGTWVSAFVPLHDPSGRVEGVMGVDFDAHDFIAAINNAKLRILGLLALLGLVVLGSSTLDSVLRAQINERKKTEESLRFLGSAVEQARESIMITDAELDLPGPRIVFINPAFTQMTGYAAAEVLGKTPRILQGPRTDKAVLTQLRKNLERGEASEGETINYRKDGTEYYQEWQIAPLRDAAGKITHYVAIQRDITKRRQAMDELAWKTALLEAQVNSILDGILMVDEQGRKLLQNQRTTDLLKIPQHIADDKDDEKQVRWVTGMMKAPGQFIEKATYLYAHPDETSHDEIEMKNGTILDRYSAPVRGKDGKHYGRIWTFRDITERKRMEGRLVQSQKMETVGKLAGGIAHEFNSILTAIIGQSELLLQDLPPDDPKFKNAMEISKAAGRAATLTRQMLAYGRKQFLKPEILDLNRIILNMQGVYHLVLGSAVDMQIVPANGLHAVRADAGQIEQVIMNLIINAIDAMPNGGKLTLETANVQLDESYLRQFPDVEMKAGDYVMLAISDTGTGMSAEVKGHAFEPFYSTKDVGQGTGLGLSTCYGIIKQSGGHISVYSEPGIGSTFKIYLPQVEPPAEVRPRRIEPLELPRGTETILLVEDDPALREMAATLLRRLGYTVFEAANGLEALRLRQQRDMGHVDLLFTDVVMPHMSGKELAERIRALYRHTRILFTSAYTENAIVHQGVLDPGVALLQKPFTPSALARKVREILDAEKT